MRTYNTASKNVEGSEVRGRENRCCTREYLNIVHRLLGVNCSYGHFHEGSDRHEKHIIGNWEKGDHCYTVAESLSELYAAVIWNTKLENSFS